MKKSKKTRSGLFLIMFAACFFMIGFFFRGSIGSGDDIMIVEELPAVDSETETPDPQGDGEDNAVADDVGEPQGGGITSDEESTGSSAEAQYTAGLININTATLDELKILPGIGDVLAQRIIDYREENGMFTAIDEITEVRGIGNGIYEKIHEMITI